MPSIKIDGFSGGIDMRRISIESKPGALEVLENAFINAGGEIEVLPAFFHDGTTLPAGCFGLEYTDVGFVTFGSGATPLGLPSSVTYQRLRHPIYYQGGADIAMTDVVASKTFKGKAFVAAKFADDRVALYYDGVLIDQSHEGEVLQENNAAGSVHAIADRIALAFVRLGFQAWGNVDKDGNEAEGHVIVCTPTDDTMAVTPEVTSDNGDISCHTIDVDSAATSGVGAVVQYVAARLTLTVTVGGAGVVNAYAPYSAGGLQQLIGTYTAAAGALPNEIAAGLVASIKARAWEHGYDAEVNGAVFTVYAPAELGNFTDELYLSATGAITIILGGVEVQPPPDPTALVGYVDLLKPKNPELYPGSLQTFYDRHGLVTTVTLGRICRGRYSGGNGGAVTFTWAEQPDVNDKVKAAMTAKGYGWFRIHVRGKDANGVAYENGTANATEVDVKITLPSVDMQVVGYFQCTIKQAGMEDQVVKFLVTVAIT